MEEQLIDLYESIPALKDVGTYQQFEQAMQTPEGRRQVYDNVPALKDIGSPEQWEAAYQATTRPLDSRIADEPRRPGQQPEESADDFQKRLQEIQIKADEAYKRGETKGFSGWKKRRRIGFQKTINNIVGDVQAIGTLIGIPGAEEASERTGRRLAELDAQIPTRFKGEGVREEVNAYVDADGRVNQRGIGNPITIEVNKAGAFELARDEDGLIIGLPKESIDEFNASGMGQSYDKEIDVGSALQNSEQTLYDIATLIGGTTGVARGVGRVAGKAAAKATAKGAVATGAFAQSYGDNYRAALEETGDSNKAANIAATQSGATAALTLIFGGFETQLPAKLSGIARQGVARTIERTASEYARGQISRGALIKTFTERLVRDVGLELTEETLDGVASNLLAAAQGIDGDVMSSDEFEEILLTTIIASTGPSTINALTGLKSNILVNSAYAASKNPDEFTDLVNQLVEDGQIKPEEGAARIRAINMVSASLDATEGLSETQKVELTGLLLSKRNEQAKYANADENMRAKIQERIDQLDEEINRLTNAQTEDSETTEETTEEPPVPGRGTEVEGDEGGEPTTGTETGNRVQRVPTEPEGEEEATIEEELGMARAPITRPPEEEEEEGGDVSRGRERADYLEGREGEEGATQRGGLEGVESFETARGSVYTVLDDGRTQRFKTATGEQSDPQDLMVFFNPPPLDQQQEWLSAVQRPERDPNRLVVIDADTEEVINTNEEAQGRNLAMALVDRQSGEIVDRIDDVTTTPTMGYQTFDQRVFEKDGSRWREKHIGNAVTKINRRGETTPTEPSATELPEGTEIEFIAEDRGGPINILKSTTNPNVRINLTNDTYDVPHYTQVMRMNFSMTPGLIKQQEEDPQEGFEEWTWEKQTPRLKQALENARGYYELYGVSDLTEAKLNELEQALEERDADKLSNLMREFTTYEKEVVYPAAKERKVLDPYRDAAAPEAPSVAVTPAEPLITRDDVEMDEDDEGFGSVTVTNPDGEEVSLDVELMEYEELPDEMFHVTSNMSGVQESGSLKATTGLDNQGLGDDIDFDGISFTPTEEGAALIEKSMKRAIKLANTESNREEQTIANIRDFFSEIEFEDSPRKYSALEKFNEAEERGFGDQTPLQVAADIYEAYNFNNDIEGVPVFNIENLKGLSEDNVGVVRVDKSAIPKNALVTRGTDVNVDEVRIAANNVPIKGQETPTAPGRRVPIRNNPSNVQPEDLTPGSRFYIMDTDNPDAIPSRVTIVEPIEIDDLYEREPEKPLNTVNDLTEGFRFVVDGFEHEIAPLQPGDDNSFVRFRRTGTDAKGKKLKAQTLFNRLSDNDNTKYTTLEEGGRPEPTRDKTIRFTYFDDVSKTDDAGRNTNVRNIGDFLDSIVEFEGLDANDPNSPSVPGYFEDAPAATTQPDTGATGVEQEETRAESHVPEDIPVEQYTVPPEKQEYEITPVRNTKNINPNDRVFFDDQEWVVVRKNNDGSLKIRNVKNPNRFADTISANDLDGLVTYNKETSLDEVTVEVRKPRNKAEVAKLLESFFNPTADPNAPLDQVSEQAIATAELFEQVFIAFAERNGTTVEEERDKMLRGITKTDTETLQRLNQSGQIKFQRTDIPQATSVNQFISTVNNDTDLLPAEKAELIKSIADMRRAVEGLVAWTADEQLSTNTMDGRASITSTSTQGQIEEAHTVINNRIDRLLTELINQSVLYADHYGDTQWFYRELFSRMKKYNLPVKGLSAFPSSSEISTWIDNASRTHKEEYYGTFDDMLGDIDSYRENDDNMYARKARELASLINIYENAVKNPDMPVDQRRYYIAAAKALKEQRQMFLDYDNIVKQGHAAFSPPYTLSILSDPMFVNKKGKYIKIVSIEQTLRQPHVKQIEKDIINDVLKTFEGQKSISYDEFERAVRAASMPLKWHPTHSWADWGANNTHMGRDEGFEQVSHIWNAPLDHGYDGDIHWRSFYSSYKNTKYQLRELRDPNTNTIYYAAVEEGAVLNNQEDIQNSVANISTDRQRMVDWIRDRENVSSVPGAKINVGLFGHSRIWTKYDDDGNLHYYIAEMQGDPFQKEGYGTHKINATLQELVIRSYQNQYERDPNSITDEKQLALLQQMKELERTRVSIREAEFGAGVPYPVVQLAGGETAMMEFVKTLDGLSAKLGKEISDIIGYHKGRIDKIQKQRKRVLEDKVYIRADYVGDFQSSMTLWEDVTKFATNRTISTMSDVKTGILSERDATGDRTTNPLQGTEEWTNLRTELISVVADVIENGNLDAFENWMAANAHETILGDSSPNTAGLILDNARNSFLRYLSDFERTNGMYSTIEEIQNQNMIDGYSQITIKDLAKASVYASAWKTAHNYRTDGEIGEGKRILTSSVQYEGSHFEPDPANRDEEFGASIHSIASRHPSLQKGSKIMDIDFKLKFMRDGFDKRIVESTVPYVSDDIASIPLQERGEKFVDWGVELVNTMFDLGRQIKKNTKEFEAAFTPQDKQFIAHRKNYMSRLLREEIRQAALRGAKYVYIPTPRTLAFVERYTDTDSLFDELSGMTYEVQYGDENGRLEIGDEIIEEDYGRMTVVFADSAGFGAVEDRYVNRASLELWRDDLFANDEEQMDYEFDRIDNLEFESAAELAKEIVMDITPGLSASEEIITNVISYLWKDVPRDEDGYWYFNRESDNQAIKEASDALYDRVRDMLENYWSNTINPSFIAEGISDQEVVDLIAGNYENVSLLSDDDTVIWTDYGQEVIPFSHPESFDNEVDTNAEQHLEDFSISNYGPDHQTVLNKYVELNKLFKELRPDAELVTREEEGTRDDGRDILDQWWRTEITPEDFDSIILFQDPTNPNTGVSNNGATFGKFSAPKILAALESPDASTAIHELAHLFEDFIDQIRPGARGMVLRDYNEFTGENKGRWDTAVSEFFARSWEEYIRQPKEVQQTHPLRRLFDDFTTWLQAIYQGAVQFRGRDLTLSDDMRSLFDQILDIRLPEQEQVGRDEVESATQSDTDTGLDEEALEGQLEGIKMNNETFDAVMRTLGLDVASTPLDGKKAIEVQIAEAIQKGYTVPGRALAIAQAIVYGDKTGIDPAEQIGIAYTAFAVANRIHELNADLDQFRGQGVTGDVTAMERTIDQLEESLDLLVSAFKITGTSYGRGLNIRGRLLSLTVFSEQRMLDRAERRKGEPLTDADKKKVKKHYKAYRDAAENFKEELLKNQNAKQQATRKSANTVVRDASRKSKETGGGRKKTERDVQNEINKLNKFLEPYGDSDVKFQTPAQQFETQLRHNIYNLAVALIQARDLRTLNEVIAAIQEINPNIGEDTISMSLATHDRNQLAQIVNDMKATQRQIRKEGKAFDRVEELVDRMQPGARQSGRIKSFVNAIGALRQAVFDDIKNIPPATLKDLMMRFEEIEGSYFRGDKTVAQTDIDNVKAHLRAVRGIRNMNDPDQRIQAIDGRIKNVQNGNIGVLSQEDIKIDKIQETASLKQARSETAQARKALSDILQTFDDQRRIDKGYTWLGELGKTPLAKWVKKYHVKLQNDGYEVFRTMLAMLDMSMVFNQAGLHTLASITRPHELRSAFFSPLWTSMKAFYKDFDPRDQSFGREVYIQLISDPMHKWRDIAGLDIIEPGSRYDAEEWFESHLLDGTQLGRIKNSSESAYTTYMNIIRARMFDNIIKNDPTILASEENLKAVANTINMLTGRSKLPQRSGRVLGLVFFAPRYYWSRIQILNRLVTGGLKIENKYERRLFYEEMARTMAGFAILMVGAALMGFDHEWDPKKNQLLKVKIGDQAYDMTGGLGQFIRLVASLGTLAIEGMVLPDGKQISDKRSNQFFDNMNSPWSSITQFLKYKLHPGASTVFMSISGTDAIGRPLGRNFAERLKGAAYRSVFPISAQALTDPMTTDVLTERKSPLDIEYWNEDMKNITASFFGVGVTDYDNMSKAKQVIDYLDSIDKPIPNSRSGKEDPKWLAQSEWYKHYYKVDFQNLFGQWMIGELEKGRQPRSEQIDRKAQQLRRQVRRMYEEKYGFSAAERRPERKR